MQLVISIFNNTQSEKQDGNTSTPANVENLTISMESELSSPQRREVLHQLSSMPYELLLNCSYDQSL